MIHLMEEPPKSAKTKKTKQASGTEEKKQSRKGRPEREADAEGGSKKREALPTDLSPMLASIGDIDSVRQGGRGLGVRDEVGRHPFALAACAGRATGTVQRQQSR
jgi:hypothetical protein